MSIRSIVGNRPKVVVVAVALAAVCALALSTTAVADDKSSGKFDYRELTLDNGLKVISLEDFSCPMVAVQLWYHVGSKDEQIDRQGFAHMFEHMMFQGTDRLGPTGHFENVRRTGGDCNAYTSFDQTVYIQDLPADQLEMVMWLEAERMSFLRVDQKSFDTERKVVEEERRLGLNRPYGTAPEKVLAELFKTHPYRWTPIGQIPHLRAAEVRELRDFWTRYYVPNNATLVVCGAVRHADVQSLAKQYFGWIPRYDTPPRVTVKEPMLTGRQKISIKEDNAPLTMVALAYRTVPSRHPDAPALQLLGAILGGGTSSRVYRDLVAEKQSAVFALAASFSLEQEGFFGAVAALSPFGGDATKVRADLDAQVAKLRKEKVTEKELLKAKNQMLKQEVTQKETVASKASMLGQAAVIEGDLSRVNQRFDAIRNITADDLLRVAQTYLVPERTYDLTIEGSLLGTMLSKLAGEKSGKEPAVTAKAETAAPKPGRPGLRRPTSGYPEKPPIAAAKPFKSSQKVIRRELQNGLKLVVIPNDELPYVSATLGLKYGAFVDDKPGTANMTLSMLTKGAGKFDEAKLAEEMETYAIGLSGNAGMDSSTVSAGCLIEHLDRAMGLLGDVVLSPTFPEKELAKEKKQLKSALMISAAEPGNMADKEMRKRLYGNHPYAREVSGEAADVDKIGVDDLKKWWGTFARPEMATLTFSGDIDEAKAVALAEKTFGSWKNSTPAVQVSLPPTPERQATHIYLVDKPSTVQSQIRVGQVSINRKDADFHVGKVVAGYFGESFNARLNETIRVKRGLTYGARGGFVPQRFAGQFNISTFSKTETAVEAVKAVFEELDRLQKEAPTTDELSMTQSSIIGGFVRKRETPQQLAGDLMMLETEGLPDNYFDNMLDTVSKTTYQDCLRVIGKHVDSKKMVVVIVGKADKLKAELEKIAPVTVVKPK